jgi:hypothetical protein
MNRLNFLLLLLLSQTAFAQNAERIEELISQKRKQIDQIEQLDSKTLTYVPSIFAKEFLSRESVRLNELTIIKVYYVYTQYRRSSSFNQKELDRDRFERLDQIITNISLDPYIEWEILEQTGCKDYRDGPNYFHGFILIHRPELTEEDRMDEINALINYFDKPTEEFVEIDLDLVNKQISDSICDCEFEKLREKRKTENASQRAEFKKGEHALYEYFKKNLMNSEEVSLKRDDVWLDTKFKVDESGRITDISFTQNYPKYLQDEIKMVLIKMPDWYPAVEKGKAISSTVNLQIRISYNGNVKGMFTRDFLKPRFNSDEITIPGESSTTDLMVDQAAVVLKSTTVYRGLETIDFSEKVAVVMDVTGSMSSNIAALQKWIIMQNGRETFTSFTFFNDGDNKPSKKKKIGSTGGIYHCKSMNEVKQTIKTAMMQGEGGERPENDVEAILYALDQDDECDAILLIGDNYSEVRDLSLLSKVSRKVHVLPCAAPKAVRPDYLNIARRTGGYMIVDGQVRELIHVQKGDRYFLNGAEYKFNGKEFQLKE